MTDQAINSVNEQNRNDSLVNSDAVEKLSSGLLALYKPELERVKKQLLEFTKKQDTLLEQLKSENQNFQEVMETTELHEVMATVKACHGKLTNIKKEMGVIHDRTNRLKKRALRLQQAKQRESLARTQQREERLLHEQSLIAQPSHRSGAGDAGLATAPATDSHAPDATPTTAAATTTTTTATTIAVTTTTTAVTTTTAAAAGP